MEFVLVGPHQGKDIRLGGFVFRKGVAEVPEDAKDAHNLLRNFYSAYPAHLIGQDEKGTLIVREPDAPAPSFLTTLQVGAPAPAPVAEPEDLNAFSKPELVERAQQMGVSVDGTKADLIARISDATQKSVAK